MQFGGRSLRSEGLVGYGILRDFYLLRWSRGIDGKRVVPARGWIDLPIGGHSSIAQLQPVLANVVGEHQGSSLHRNRAVKTNDNSGLHGKGDLHGVALLPFPFQSREAVYVCGGLVTAVNEDHRVLCPMRNAQQERKF